MTPNQLRKLVENGPSPLQNLFDKKSIGAAVTAMHVIFELSKKPKYAEHKAIARHDCVSRIRGLKGFKSTEDMQGNLAYSHMKAEEMIGILMHEGVIYAGEITLTTKPLKVIWPRLDHAAWTLFTT